MRKIVDGDTYVAGFDLGWGQWREEVPGAPCRVRFLNYQAPERYAPRGPEATAILAVVLPIGTITWVRSQKLDSFGRALSHVFLKDGTNVLDLLPSEWRV